MKPSIVNWAYVGLVFLWLSNMQSVVSTFNYVMTSNDDFVYSPVLSIISVVIIVVSTVAIFGLIKKYLWARIVAYSVIGVQAFLMLGMMGSNIYLTSTTPLPVSPSGFLVVFSVFGIFLLFLVYKLYASEPLKLYLSKPS